MNHTTTPPARPTGSRRRPLLAAVAGLALVVGMAGCGSDSGSDSAKAADATTTTAAAGSDTSAGSATGSDSAAADVKLADTDLGSIVVDGKGNTLYAFVPDSATTSACTGGCATTWPPLATSSTPKGDGVGAEDLGTLSRDDGTTQITFYGHPLYTYAGDSSPGDTNGQGVGGAWYVVDSSGALVKDSPKGATPTSADSGY